MSGKIRQICIRYWFDKDQIMLTLAEEKLQKWTTITLQYGIDDFEDWTELYNRALNDFDAEYDDDVAEGLEITCEQFWKEKEKCDLVTQE